MRESARRWLEEAHGDQDLGVDESGEFVPATMFPPDVAGNLRPSMRMLGMKPADLLRSVFGGGVPGGPPPGPGIDPQKALDLLDKMGKEK
ncbi:MAG: hypothetical protein HYZ53_06775 [Planctomycetes bacterium]|nr:hypothetical protein [Planctomycetota bacterium]